MNWKTTATDGAPKPKTATSGNVTTRQSSDQFLCFDGETVFEIYYAFDLESEELWFLKNVTKYIRISDIPKPI